MGVHVTFVDSKGVRRTIVAAEGASVMEAAIDRDIPEVQTECGGVGSCAACHVYVDAAWADRFDPVGKIENSLLSLLESRTPASRLSCQLKLTSERDGAVIHTLDPAADV